MAQFVNIPPLEMVKELFVITTGVPFSEGISWTVWLPLDPSDLYIFLPYIRKCHQQLLIETANRIQNNACSFLRQILRPHNFSIKLKKKMYYLCDIKEDAKTVGKKEGTTVVWTDS
jgi:hypothetical protein